MNGATWFVKFNANLAVANAVSISRRYNRITRQLNTDFWNTESGTAHSLYVGSYGRNTAIDGLSDVDMLFQLPGHLFARYDRYQGNGQSALLQAVRQSIQTTYPTTELGADGQILAIAFVDGITFEILPAFLKDGRGFAYPDSNEGGTWRFTDPRAEILAIRLRNQTEANGNLIRLCRAMRAWKYTWQVPIGGLLLDTLAYNFVGTWPFRNKSFRYYGLMFRDFFEYMANQNSEQTYWLAPGSRRGAWRTGLFEYKAKRCYNISRTALEYETKNYEYSAKQTWGDIFGHKFPN